ncbi:MurT ligase domain-containing protein [Nocardioides terrisoli]|uniref:MurT ligase domain-containing protein n=1 Tax=Nocardioides terrisoli TaxID=3388267 RepID=UPI00287B89DC|nr:MurT ligase domain-containing protein [Nocardioides marmorisolisilvae]
MEAPILVPHPAPSPFDARLRTALTAGRSAAWLSRRLAGGGGGVIGGRVVLRMVPDAPERLSRDRTVVLVSGTNGKSTTTAMLRSALAGRYPTTSNLDGANTGPGLVTALADVGSHAVLETDEGWLPWAVRRTRPAIAVLLNLSRDQLDRHPEVQGLAAAWRSALAEVPLVVANADDPAVVWAASAAQRQIWVGAGQSWQHDAVVCPACGALLRRDRDHWSCRCGLARPEPTWTARGSEVAWHGHPLAVTLDLPGPVNLANAAMALATATAAGVPVAEGARSLAGLEQVSGRYAVFTRGDHQVRLLLAKNPAGWQSALRMIGASQRPVVLGFNAEGVDGRDPSWLYDVNFAALRHRPVAVFGRRGSDMSVRLLVDCVPQVGQFERLDGALHRLPAGPVDLVANYTAFRDAFRELAA